ncbi:hypothetical protein [Hymenobacter sediminicola]|uniref:Uncharacterized protein n=1 Tax=Hymenobacter sediminicola TaxID=2761579 RepID=A0A7G7W510_9BACT|nr:hypothetical protein [Hymenobacter sediminicola]QNH61453.1 hypothetical protein H4317_14990 [Hymenobacter sediminicola]
MKPIASPKTAAKPVSWWALLPGIFLFLSFWSLFFSEWLTIGIIADPATIGSYSFGSEAMLAEGGQHYRTANTYATSALLAWVLLLPAGLAFVQAMRRRTPVRALLAYGILSVTLTVLPLLNSL